MMRVIQRNSLFTIVPLTVAMFLCVGGRAAAQNPASAPAPDAQAIFTRSCAVCHTGAQDSRAPSLDALHQHSPESVI